MRCNPHEDSQPRRLERRRRSGCRRGGSRPKKCRATFSLRPPAAVKPHRAATASTAASTRVGFFSRNNLSDRRDRDEPDGRSDQGLRSGQPARRAWRPASGRCRRAATPAPFAGFSLRGRRPHARSGCRGKLRGVRDKHRRQNGERKGCTAQRAAPPSAKAQNHLARSAASALALASAAALIASASVRRLANAKDSRRLGGTCSAMRR